MWVTQSISVFGSALTFFALTIWLTQVQYPLPEQKADLAWALSAIGLTFGIPNVIAAPFAGAWADRHDRKRTMMAMDFLSGCLSVILVFLIVNRQLNLPILLVIMAAASTAGSFHNSAFDTSYAMLVPEALLPRANGMMQTIFSLSAILSPAAAATLIALPALARQGVIPGGLGAFLGRIENGTSVAIGLDAVTFFLAAATLLFLSIPSPRIVSRAGENEARANIWADIREGALYIWRRRPMLWLLGTFTIANLTLSMIGVLTPMLVKFNLAADWLARGMTFETALALLASIGGMGGVAGGVLISAWGGLKKRRVYGVVGAMILCGLALVFFGLIPALFAAAAMNAVMEGTGPIMNAHSQAIWQAQTPHELQGRVFAVRRVIAQFTVPLSTVLAGLLGGLFNPGIVLAFSGSVLVLFCVAQLFNPVLLRVEDKKYLDALAAEGA